MEFKLLSQKMIPVTLAVLTGVAVVSSSIHTNPKDYTVQAVEVPGDVEETKTEGKKTAKKTGIEVGSTEALPATTAAAAAGGSSQGSPSVDKVAENQTYKDGVYTGSGQGYRGTITVKVTITNGKIAKIDVVSHQDDAQFFNRAKALLSRIIEGQTTNVDAVSGASYSSAGLIRAVRDALSKASGSSSSGGGGSETKTTQSTETTAPTIEDKPSTATTEDETEAVYKDGTYYGEGKGFRKGITKVKVVISKGKIKSVAVVSHGDGDDYMKKAKSLLSKIVKKQSTNVDAVSGATYSSNGIIEATRNALKKAKIKPDKDDEDTTEKTTEATEKTTETDKTEDTQENSTEDTADTTQATEVTETTGDTGSTEETEATTQPTTVYKDGTYQVSVACEPDEYEDFDTYQLSMSVTIKDDRITAITGVTGKPADATNKSFIKMAVNKVVPNIVSKGTPDGVDAVSGATCSSRSIINGCLSALGQAKN